MFNPVKVDGDKKEEEGRETQNKRAAQELGPKAGFLNYLERISAEPS